MKKYAILILLTFMLFSCSNDNKSQSVPIIADYRDAPFGCKCSVENEDVAISFSLKRDGDTYEIVMLSPEETAGSIVMFGGDRVDMVVNEFSVILSPESAEGLKAVPLALLHDVDGCDASEGKYSFTEGDYSAELTVDGDGIPTSLVLTKGENRRDITISDFTVYASSDQS